MKAITDGCHTAADVDVKKSDFYHKLQYAFGITEDPQDNYYGEENFTSNLESFDYDDEDDKRKKKETAVKFISHINKLRNGTRFHSDLDSEHIIVTNTKATLLISQGLLWGAAAVLLLLLLIGVGVYIYQNFTGGGRYEKG